ncbi:hypothetical protein FC093_06565 [Ilyomonas limi]|uniref:Uncharacterized protein n=1 Tax=Ilyomonas limi TaxID=2575867 RepID=A0A4U3L5S9_9BACT|nr:hypothetical protein [Ilyomonas limi]TKK69749.1 hypothetical protein FC093_06565 [Ilyomonas limi]
MKQAYFIILALTIIVLIYKTVHYWRYFSGKKLYCWFYFGRNEIMLSSTTSRCVAKKWQNVLSLATLIGLILSSYLYFLMY